MGYRLSRHSGKGAIVISKTEQMEAAYRVALKRICRIAGQIIANDAPTPELEQRVKDVTKYAPALTARHLERLYENAARAWERGNNSGNSAILNREEDNCDKIRETADRLMALWQIKVDYPGLYPSFQFDGGDYYSAESVLIAVSRKQLTTIPKP